MDKKYQVFISSTYTDLKRERQKVCDAVLTLYQIPIGMEMFSAADEEQWEIIQSHIDDSDFYVLILGNRYGSVIEEGIDAGISYTEKEFNYAVSVGVPVLVFIIGDTAPITIDKVEKDPHSIEKLKAFKERASKGREVVWWENEDELATKVTASLSKQIMRNKRPGWIRATSINQNKEKKVMLLSQEDHDIDCVPQNDTNVICNGIDNIKNSVNSIHVSDDKKKDIGTSGTVDYLETLEKNIYEQYNEVIRPLLVMLEVRNAEQPIEIINEISSTFGHLSKYKLTGNESQLKNAFSHIARAEIDIYKYLCVSIEDKFDTLINNRKKSIFKTERVPYILLQQNKHAKEMLMSVREAEIQGMNFDDLRVLYENVLKYYMELDEEMDRYVESMI